MSTALSTLPDELARQLRAARTRAHLSQAELAERLGCSLRTVQNWESGRGMLPQPAHRRRIAAFLAESETDR